MAEETIFTNEDFTGGSFEEGATLSLGTRFHVTDSGNAKRARFYCPPSGPGGSGTVLMRLHQVTGGPTLLATATFASPTVGAWNETDWIVSGSPALVPLVINTVYSTSYVTPNRYVASTAYTWPKISNGLHIESESPGGYFSSGDAMPAGTFGGNNYYADCVVEFGSGTTPVTSTLDARWQVRNLVAGTLDARWSVSNTVSSTLDLRWQVRNIVQQTLDAQWAVRNAVTSTLDARWAVRVSVSSTLDARWQVRAQAIGTLDARWAVLQPVTSTLDARWQVKNAVTATADLRWVVDSSITTVTSTLDLRWATAGSVTSTLDARWAVKGVVTGALDVRWAVRNQITAALDVRWQTRQRATGTVDLRWIVDGEVFVPKSDVRAYLSQRVRARPTIAQIRAYL